MRAISRLFSWLALLLFVSVAGMTAIGAAYNPNILVESRFKGQHVAVDGLPIRVIEQGTGPDVLLIHGSPGSLEDWTALMSRLEGSFRVHAYDRPGYGFSGDSGKYSLADNAKTALGLIATLGLKQVTVVGHSYGGATALAMALTAPERVTSFVIIDSSVYTPARPPEELSSMLAIPMLGIGFATVLGPVLAPARIREGIRNQFRSEPPAGFIDARVRMWASPKVLHAQAMESLGARDELAAQSPRYPQIRAKVQILGQADDADRRKSAERLHADVRGSTLQLVHGAGHYLQIEKPDEVAEAIRASARE